MREYCSRKLESKAVVVASQFLNYLSRPRIHSSHTGFAICINGIMGISCGEAATQIFHPSFFFCFLSENFFLKKEIEFVLYLFLFYGGWNGNEMTMILRALHFVRFLSISLSRSLVLFGIGENHEGKKDL